jgi:hypothetical protein
MMMHRLFFILFVLSTSLWAGAAHACENAAARACIADAIIADAMATTEPQWRDQILRDVSGSLTLEGRVDDAIALVGKIENPDTQAMAVRTIGMASALYGKNTPEQMRDIFVKLKKAASIITQPDAHAIALTYIAMAQAFAGMDDDAWATAAAMTNAALRHKAYGETAEIQAERGDFPAAAKSIGFIDTASFRNKAYQKISEILIKKENFDDALKAAQMIDNPTKRAQAMQELLHAQEKQSRGPRRDQF